jgi:hypothetical protein
MELLTEWIHTVGKTIKANLYLGLRGFYPNYDIIIFTDESMIILRMESGDYHSRDGIVGSYEKFKDEPKELFDFLHDNSIFPTSIKLERYSWDTDHSFSQRIKINGTDTAT